MKPSETNTTPLQVMRTLRTSIRECIASIDAKGRARVQHFLNRHGLYLTRRPHMLGSASVIYSFPPYDELEIVGRPETFFIHEGYVHRDVPEYFDDTKNSEGWQNEVYQYAWEIAERYDLRTVLDFGCGSGFKLMKYFRDRSTIGLDVEETYAVLCRRYPERQWRVADLSSEVVFHADLVIASDVIEHLLDPDTLLRFIARSEASYAVLSTPDRNLMRIGTHNGPPQNPAHLREWSMAEFHAYLSRSFEVVEHFISSTAQATQCALVRINN